MTTSTRPHGSLTGQPAEERFPVPLDEHFEFEGDVAYLAAPDLSRIGSALIAAHEARFGHLQSRELVFLWKRQGGKSKGRARLYNVQQPSGLLAYFAAKAESCPIDYAVWLAADHCRERVLTNVQIEALVHHALLHTHEDENGNATIIGHDYEGFVGDISEYGLWAADLQAMGRAVQGRLFDEDGGAAGSQGDGVESITFSTAGRERVTLTKDHLPAIERAIRSLRQRGETGE